MSAAGVTDSALQHRPCITHLGQINYCEEPEKLHRKAQWLRGGGAADKRMAQSRGERQMMHSAALHTPGSREALLCWNGSPLWNTMLGAACERPDIGLCEHGHSIVVTECAPDSNFSFAVKRNNTGLIDTASWAQGDVPFVRRWCYNRAKHTARSVSISTTARCTTLIYSFAR